MTTADVPSTHDGHSYSPSTVDFQRTSDAPIKSSFGPVGDIADELGFLRYLSFVGIGANGSGFELDDIIVGLEAPPGRGGAAGAGSFGEEDVIL